MLYIILGILFFGLLIAVHEWGHFITAKKLEEHGRKADVTASRFTVEGMTEAVSEDWSRRI